MEVRTRPVPSPKPACKSRANALLAGELHDLLELGVAPVGHAAALPWAIIDLAADLPCRGPDPHQSFMRLHCGPDEDGGLVATLGLAEEL